jgi:hypothetical protein
LVRIVRRRARWRWNDREGWLGGDRDGCRQDARPAGADPRVTARFLAGGVLGVIGAWLADPRPEWSPEDLVEALIQCLPGWLNTD